MTDDAQLVRLIAIAALELAEAAGADIGATSDLRRVLERAGNAYEPPRVDQRPQPGEASPCPTSPLSAACSR